MTKKAYHSLSYLRAQTSQSHVTTLQEDLIGVLEALPDVDMRTVEYAGKILTGTILEKRDGMLLLQFVASIPGEQASTLPTQSSGKRQIKLETMDAPEGHDFSNGDLICLIVDNDVFVCASAMRDTMLYPFLVQLFKKQDKDVLAEDWNLVLLRGAQKNAVRHIQEHGIKSLQLMATTNAMSLSSYSAQKDGNILQRFFASDTPLLENVKASNARVCLSISRTRGSRADFAWLEAEAHTAFSGDVDYMIKTMDNYVITPANMIIRQRKQFDAHGQSVFLDEAVQKLKEFRSYVQSNN